VPPVLDGFERRRIAVGDAELNLLMGGEGPPVLLLHGYPQTHVMWHKVAPRLADRFSLVIPDLRGYGDSLGPTPDAEHRNYAKRAMAQDAVRLMEILGHPRFMLAGHDRGARVAYRLALDHPQRVSRLAVLDIVPTLDVWEQMDWKEALATYHWPFLAVPAPLPETLIGANPDFYLHHLLDRWAGRREALDPAAVAEYERAFRKPSVIAATCADYRAGASLDVAHDRADREAGRRIACPVLVIWGRDYLGNKVDSPLSTWRVWAGDVREVPLDCGHFLAEEEPEASAAAFRDFFSA
jgi:haloacetate dehalogenase